LFSILASMVCDNIENNLDGNPSEKNKKEKNKKKKIDTLTANIERVARNIRIFPLVKKYGHYSWYDT